jgi:hypothetical protein
MAKYVNSNSLIIVLSQRDSLGDFFFPSKIIFFSGYISSLFAEAIKMTKIKKNKPDIWITACIF